MLLEGMDKAYRNSFLISWLFPIRNNKNIRQLNKHCVKDTIQKSKQRNIYCVALSIRWVRWKKMILQFTEATGRFADYNSDQV